jgi:hypothetical protein
METVAGQNPFFLDVAGQSEQSEAADVTTPPPIIAHSKPVDFVCPF